MAKRARQPSDDAQCVNVDVEVQQLVDAAIDGDIVDAPFGAKFGNGRSRPAGTPPQPRAQTFVSAVNGGAHLNLYLSAAMMAVAGQWEHGAQIRWHCKHGKPDIVRLRAAAQKAYTIRTHGQQRPHFTVPTASVGGGLSNLEALQVESWVEGDEICIRVPQGIFSGIFRPSSGIFSNGERQP
jgi:hypothetical protein